MASKTYRVKQVAELSGLTVRALHHYDSIGLLQPSGRTTKGYRLYSESDVLLLQQILVYRELGLPLEKIKAVINDPDFDRHRALVEQRKELQARAEQTEAMLRAVDSAIQALEGDTIMNAKELFDGFDPGKYEAEAKARWGETEQYAESMRRTKSYSPEDWKRIKTETNGLMRRFAEALQAGVDPGSEAAMDLAEEHRLQIERFYYPCSHAMHRNLGQMYLADSRFQANIDRHGEGVTVFLSAAIEANCDRAES